jgi:hypothetical protein
MLPSMLLSGVMPRELPTGPLAGCMWLALGLSGIAKGLFGSQFRKGRFGQGEIITTP